MERKNLWVAAQALVSAALLAWLLRGLDLAAFRALFTRLPLWFYAASLAVILAGQIVYAWRWRLLLVAAGARVPFPAVLRQYFIGIFINNFLPSTVGGDVAKVYFLGREYGYRTVTASVVLDRLLGVGLLAVFAAAMLWSARLPSPVLVVARLAVTGIGATAVTVLAVAAAGTGGLPARVARLGPTAIAVAARLQRFRIDMAASLRDPWLILQAAAVVVGYFLAVAAVYVVFVELQTDVVPPFTTTLGIVATTSVLSNVPVSLNGLGVREQLHAVLLAPLGISRELAVAISLLLYGHLLVASLVGFVFWLRAPAVPAPAPAGART